MGVQPVELAAEMAALIATSIPPKATGLVAELGWRTKDAHPVKLLRAKIDKISNARNLDRIGFGFMVSDPYKQGM